MNYYNYFTEVEEHFIRRRGKGIMVSPLDWSLIATWKETGVPLHIALRGIDVAMDGYLARPRRETERLSTLFYCHDAVMEEFERYAEQHVGAGEGSAAQEQGARQPDLPDAAQLLAFIDARKDEITALQAKLSDQRPVLESVDRVLARLGEIRQSLADQGDVDLETLERDLGIADELLMAALHGAVGPDQESEWLHEGRKQLRIYKKRLPKETYKKLVDNFVRTHLRRHFGVGELSVLQL